MGTELAEETCIIAQPCYKLANCPQIGRHLVATRDIKKGEVILKDQPLATGPIKGSTLLCPGCYETSPETNCPKCGWPICSESCPGLKSHHQLECKLFQDRKAPTNDWDWSQLSDCLMLVRCLLQKRLDPRKWGRLLEMETNWKNWLTSPHHSYAEEIEPCLRSDYSLTPEEYSTSLIFKVQAILDINAYEVRLPDSNIQAAYQLASLAEHSCLPNTHKTICSDSLELTFRAATDIPQGTHISTTYCDILWPTWHRQKYLQWSKFFICSCHRCHSPSELESHLGSFLCMDCFRTQNQSRPAPALPIQKDGWASIKKDYQCTTCLATFPAYECQLMCKKSDNELSHLDNYASYETLHTYEAWLQKWTLLEEREDDDREGKHEAEIDPINPDSPQDIEIPKQTQATCYANPRLVLHPQHSLVLDCCHTLFLLYPKEDSTLQQLRRKERLGTHLLRATKPLFTGISKFRGTISYELAMTKAAILVHQLEQSGMSDGLQLLAEEVLQLLAESQEMLKYESEDTPEGKLVQTGCSQLEQLSSFFAEIFPTFKHNTKYLSI